MEIRGQEEARPPPKSHNINGKLFKGLLEPSGKRPGHSKFDSGPIRVIRHLTNCREVFLKDFVEQDSSQGFVDI